MYPATPRPVSGTSRSKMPTDRSDEAFREITGSMNVVSRSEQNFETVLKNAGEMIEKRSVKSGTLLRRRSIPSKYAGSNSEKSAGLSSALQIKRGLSSVVPRTENLRAANKGTFWGNTTRRVAPKNQLLPTDDLKKSVLGSEKGSASMVGISATMAKPLRAPHRARVLHSASYWLEQIKLAEAIGKHTVAIGFFRLAVECEAEPLQTLREELISYKRKYRLCSESIYQVMSCYGLTEDNQESLLSQESLHTFPDGHASQISFDHKMAWSQSAAAWSPCVSDNSVKILAKNYKYHPEQDVPTGWQPVPETIEDEDNMEASNLVHVPDGLCNLSHTALSATAYVGRIETMDVDSITREVISYLMSSMDDCINSPDVEAEANAHPRDHVAESLPHSLVVNASEVQDECEISVEEKGPIGRNFEIAFGPEATVLDQAVSTGSMPSLDAWNTLLIEADTCVPENLLVQEVHSLRGNPKDDEEEAEVVQSNAEQGSAYRQGEVMRHEDFLRVNHLTGRHSSKTLGKRIENSADQYVLSSETNESHSPDGRNVENIGEAVKDARELNSKNQEALRVKDAQIFKIHKSNGGNRDVDVNKARESDKSNVNHATSKPEFHYNASRSAAGCSTARTCSKANAPILEADSTFAISSRTRIQAGINQPVADGSDVASVPTVGQMVLNPNSCGVTPTRGSLGGDRRGRKQVYTRDDANDSIATPVVGSTAVRRSARLRSLTRMPTPCAVKTPRSVSTPQGTYIGLDV